MLGRNILFAAIIVAFIFIFLLNTAPKAHAQGSGFVVATVQIRPPQNSDSNFAKFLSSTSYTKILNNIYEDSILINEISNNYLISQIDRQVTGTSSALFRND